LVSFTAFSCDEWTDQKTGKTYRSGSPDDCKFSVPSKLKSIFSLNKEVLSLDEYIKNKVKFANVITQVSGRVIPAKPCGFCPANALCKPCYTQYFILESITKKVQLLVNYKKAPSFIRKFRSNTVVTIKLIYDKNNSSHGVQNEHGFFILR
jgi:hypothetical protein